VPYRIQKKQTPRLRQDPRHNRTRQSFAVPLRAVLPGRQRSATPETLLRKCTVLEQTEGKGKYARAYLTPYLHHPHPSPRKINERRYHSAQRANKAFGRLNLCSSFFLFCFCLVSAHSLASFPQSTRCGGEEGEGIKKRSRAQSHCTTVRAELSDKCPSNKGSFRESCLRRKKMPGRQPWKVASRGGVFFFALVSYIRYCARSYLASCGAYRKHRSSIADPTLNRRDRFSSFPSYRNRL